MTQLTVIGQALGGQPDADYCDCLSTEQRALVTIDTDFADIRAYPPRHLCRIDCVALETTRQVHGFTGHRENSADSCD